VNIAAPDGRLVVPFPHILSLTRIQVEPLDQV
jgi:hypothetical protein